jgi:predicted site-specific integrase-resolvase
MAIAAPFTQEKPRWVTERELCELIDLSRDTLRRRRKEGLLKPAVHYRTTGYSRNSCLRYDLEAVKAEMAKWARTRTRTFQTASPLTVRLSEDRA